MVAPVVPNQFEIGKNKIVHKPTKRRLVSTQAVPPSRASIGDVRVSNYQVAQITEKTT
jgi:hypothetical protein